MINDEIRAIKDSILHIELAVNDTITKLAVEKAKFVDG